MFANRFPKAERPLLIRSARPVGFGDGVGQPIDVMIDEQGRIAETSSAIAAGDRIEVVDAKGAFLSPGWTDLHVHVWYGGTDISLRPGQCGATRGVTTMVDAGSAGEANFHGFREFIIEPAKENVYAFLNIGSIGLVACNRVSELIDMRSIDFDRTIATVEANRDVIVGLKVRASHVITGAWDLTPVRLAKKLGRILKLPIMVHVGEPPPLYDDVLGLLSEGDIVTHCFNGKAGGSIIEDDDLYRLAEQAAARGIVLDVGHGGASFSFDVAKAALERGLPPATISTDLHNRSLDGSVWDMATTMSKLLSLGMKFEDVVAASTTAPRRAIRLPTERLLEKGKPAEFTLFDVVDADLTVRDSQGALSTLHRLFEPRHAILGAQAVAAHRHVPAEGEGGSHACPHCGWKS
ncbi:MULTISPECIES: amidohydrolase/deacetylase family metallohydrolase [unclassified Mesorhizobium]|uniref:amidohydrolase/deacetylase family metallohydrolase n=1 Tax=unclassified Mesorhizobium TaxID=325217 RepID=UPI000FCC2F7C|nr:MULTISPECIES: amidohydrolase/deacetylase family metallohydrolase [unclassified Mesorhizobium]RUW23117.1 amidohydrolase/deacetylase family metallohydrolase [Mesorhizobium sp. M1E.F.Ca.ET.041.01.1.1]RWD84848.1 MAG: amidohydrolase/deacetylase family metallohydrolase [Mesorhizobium sp.]RWD92268.1 MAG: amidohydrolase/deacetylase family metallohydrolase [Mesorhizobium sp.]